MEWELLSSSIIKRICPCSIGIRLGWRKKVSVRRVGDERKLIWKLVRSSLISRSESEDRRTLKTVGLVFFFPFRVYSTIWHEIAIWETLIRIRYFIFFDWFEFQSCCLFFQSGGLLSCLWTEVQWNLRSIEVERSQAGRADPVFLSLIQPFAPSPSLFIPSTLGAPGTSCPLRKGECVLLHQPIKEIESRP